MQHSQHEHHHEAEANRRKAATPDDIGALACSAGASEYQDDDSSSRNIRETRQGRKMISRVLDRIQRDKTNSEDEIPNVPGDLFASQKSLPSLQTSTAAPGELIAKVKIPRELHTELCCVSPRGATTPETLGVRIKAHEKLIRFLDDYRHALNLSNIGELSGELKKKGENGTLDMDDLKRARRAITGLQVEVSREIDRLKEVRYRLVWGQDYTYRIGGPHKY